MNDEQQEIINGISAEIARIASAVANEQYRPVKTVDASDDFMADGARKLKALREIRVTLENIFTGYIQMGMIGVD